MHERDIIGLKPENIIMTDKHIFILEQQRLFILIYSGWYSTLHDIWNYFRKRLWLIENIWSFSICLLEFICGMVPIGEEEEDPYEIYRAILEYKLTYPNFIEKENVVRSLIE